jgi:acetolactate synthase-1/2/3 large subunit
VPIDVQREQVPRPRRIALAPIVPQPPEEGTIELLAGMVRRASRPMLWLGGGARDAIGPARELASRGFAIVTSTNGRAVVPETHPHTLGAYTMTAEAQAVYDRADLMIVVGSRLRGNETRNNSLRLPRPLVQIDADAGQAARNAAVDLFVHADAAAALSALAGRLPARLAVDGAFLEEVGAARRQSQAKLAAALGPYRAVADALAARVAAGNHPFVRDVTLANSTFGNRYVPIAAPHLGVHALGGGIGQGVAMAIGAALAGERAKTVALLGDGGLMVNLGELATAIETAADIVFVLMNDRGYGVIRNIQDAQFGGRRHYADLHTPDFGLLGAALGLPHQRIARVEDFAAALDRALAARGSQLVEVDMVAIGPFAEAFAGPPAGAAGSA